MDEKINFGIILCLSQNPVLSSKKTFSPFFFETVGPIGLQIFLQIPDANRGTFFFLPRNLVSVKFGRPYKISRIKKTLVFDKVFSILLLVTCKNDIFSKGKKNASRFASSICRKIFSPIGWTFEFCGGENVWLFLALVTPKTLWSERLRIFVLWWTFLCSSRSIYPESFISFRPVVSQKPRKGGSP